MISLRDRNDRINLRSSGAVRGGAGHDRLTCTRACSLFGGRGNDVLRGGASYDRLDGGPGRDRLYGGGATDILIDGETDARAAPDLFDGGGAPDADGDAVDFSRRRDSVRIDLKRGRTSTGDTIVGVRTVTGGSGDDQLTGDAAYNTLNGGPGDDAIDGGAGNDVSVGGPGNDRLSGGIGNDYLVGEADRDRLDGGTGDDSLSSREAIDNGHQGFPTMADQLSCGDGADVVTSDAADTLEPACDQLGAEDVQLRTVPMLRGDHAEFTATWTFPGGLGRAAVGTLSLHSLVGEEYGKARYAVPSAGTMTISVPLTSAGVAALRAGTVVQVDLVPDPLVIAPGSQPMLIGSSGYRMFLRAG
jgi:hypothetical protein